MSEVFVIVKKGDTFQGIALENSISVSMLKKMNHIYGNNKLFVGQKLKVKECPSLLDGAKTKSVLNSSLKRGSSGSGNITWKGNGTQASAPAPMTAESKTVYDFIKSTLWRTELNSSGAQEVDKSDLIDSMPTCDDRPRSGSGLCTEDLAGGEVIVTMPPLTKSADFDTEKPRADEVVVESAKMAKIRNDLLQAKLLNAVQSDDVDSVSFLSTTGERLVDTEFDAELVEVNEDYFSSPTHSREGRTHRPLSVVKVQLNGDGAILSQSQAQGLAMHLPVILQANKWTLLYSVLNNGADMFSFYKLTKGANITVLLVETLEGEIFGGFATEQWHVDSSFYGSGESFIFKIVGPKTARVFKWSQENHFVMWSNESQLGMGGGGDGFAFALDSDFYAGQTSRSATFNNDPLVSAQGGCFQIKNVEVWKLDSSI